jgi:hypothetical protein
MNYYYNCSDVRSFDYSAKYKVYFDRTQDQFDYKLKFKKERIEVRNCLIIDMNQNYEGRSKHIYSL